MRPWLDIHTIKDRTFAILIDVVGNLTDTIQDRSEDEEINHHFIDLYAKYGTSDQEDDLNDLPNGA